MFQHWQLQICRMGDRKIRRILIWAKVEGIKVWNTSPHMRPRWHSQFGVCLSISSSDRRTTPVDDVRNGEPANRQLTAGETQESLNPFADWLFCFLKLQKTRPSSAVVAMDLPWQPFGEEEPLILGQILPIHGWLMKKTMHNEVFVDGTMPHSPNDRPILPKSTGNLLGTLCHFWVAGTGCGLHLSLTTTIPILP